MDLAAKFDVSRTTIREAIKILCSQGILEIKRGNGTYVCEEKKAVQLSPQNYNTLSDIIIKDSEEIKRDIFEIMAMQPYFAALAAKKASDESIKILNNINEEFDRQLAAYKKNNTKEDEGSAINDLRYRDVEFHKAVVEACDNQVMNRLLPNIIDEISEFYKVWVVLDKLTVLENCKRYHNLITYAIESHDSELAYRLSDEHEKAIISFYENASSIDE